MEKPEIRMRWNNAEEKLAWMRALAQLLDHLQPHPERQIDREWFTLVNDWISKEFDSEGSRGRWALGSPQPVRSSWLPPGFDVVGL
jgi:hypothetical protein